MKSTRQRDSKVSEIVTQYIYENLYKGIYENPLLITNKLAQLSGIDIWDKESGVTVDEKCRIADIEKIHKRKRDTFAIELGWMKRNGERVKGWGISSYNTPTYYNLIWLREVDVKDMQRLKLAHIREAECLFVKKGTMQTFMKDIIGYEDKIWETVNWMWNKRIDRKYYKDKNGYPYCHMTRSWQLQECPVNFVVPKAVWNKLAEHIYYVYNGRYKVIK